MADSHNFSSDHGEPFIHIAAASHRRNRCLSIEQNDQCRQEKLLDQHRGSALEFSRFGNAPMMTPDHNPAERWRAVTRRNLRIFRRQLPWIAWGILMCLTAASRPALALRTFRVDDFGAKADGKTIDTRFIQKALDAAGAAGGGIVEFSPGTYRTGSLFLRSHTRVILGKGTSLLGVSDDAAYPRIRTRAAGIEMQWPAALINVYQQTDVTIEGGGTIDGNGKRWWDRFWSLVPAYAARGLRWAVDYDVQRPELILIYQSNHVRLGGGLLLRRSAFWTVHICYSTDVAVDRLTIRDNDPADGRGPSTDGVDIDSSRHILVQRVDIANNDDGICLKAGMNADGLRVNRPTEDVVIRDSVIREGISGIAIGSDTAGGFRNIRVSGITVLPGVRYGIYFKSTHTRGGWTDDIRISHVRMKGVKVGIMADLNYFPAFSTPHIPAGIERNLPPGLSAVPSYWKTLATPVDPERGIPHFRNVTFTDIRGQGMGTAVSMKGYPQAPLENFHFDEVRLEAQHAGTIEHVRGLKLQQVCIRGEDGRPVELVDAPTTKGTLNGCRGQR
jgi:hypothetical protein